MVIGTGLATFRLHGCRSLKEKRKIVKSVVANIRGNFNVSAAEVGSNDKHQKAEIGFAMAGNDRRAINAGIDHIFNFAEKLGLSEITDTDMEIINL